MAFASVEDVTRRLEEEPSETMLRMIEAGLEEATDLAIHYGRAWTSENCPDPVRRIVARAVARWIRNPDGFEQSRAADETLIWSERNSIGDIEFTPEEIARVSALGRPATGPAFGAVPVAPDYMGTGEKVLHPYVPVAYGGDPFPFLVQEHRNRPVIL